MTDDVTDGGLYIDGDFHSLATLSFREQREMRDQIKHLAPDGDVDAAGEMDILPALIYVVKRRTDPAFTIEQALDAKLADLTPPAANGTGKKSPPRKRRASQASA